MSRNVVAWLAGLVSAVLTMVFVEALGRWWFPAVEVLGARTFEEQVREGKVYPAATFLVAGVGWALGAWLGAVVAGWVARRAPMENALLVGGLLFLSGIWSLIGAGYPYWFWPLGLGVIPAGAWLGGRTAAALLGENPSWG